MNRANQLRDIATRPLNQEQEDDLSLVIGALNKRAIFGFLNFETKETLSDFVIRRLKYMGFKIHGPHFGITTIDWSEA